MVDFNGLLSDEHVVILALCALALSFVLILAVVMACTLSTPFCLLFKYCPFGGKTVESKSERPDERPKEPLKTKQIIFYGHQPLPIPGTKAGYLDNQQKVVTSSDISGLLMTDKYQRNADMGFSFVSLSPQTFSPGSDNGPENMKSSFLPVANGAKLTQATFLNGGSLNDDLPTSLSFSLQYDVKSEKLTLYLSHAVNVALNLYGGLSDSFVRVFFVKDNRHSWLSRPEISLENLEQGDRLGYEIREQKSKIVRRSANPVFNEYFCASNLSEKDKKRTIIKFVLCTIDKYLKAKTVGHCDANLGKMELNGLTSFNVALTEVHTDLGEILLALTYLPTSQRLNVTVVKITNIKYPESDKVLNPLVKLALMQKGRTMEKHVTNVHHGCHRECAFNEQFFFDLPANELNKVVLLCSVYHKIMPPSESLPTEDESRRRVGDATTANGSRLIVNREDSVIQRRLSDYRISPKKWANGTPWRNSTDKKTTASAAGSEYSDQSDYASLRGVTRTKNKAGPFICLGRVSFGTYAKAPGRNQWLEIIRNPRKQVSQAHKLLQ